MRLLPTLSIGLIAEGTGQLVGYVAGDEDCMEKLTKIEFARIKEAKLKNVQV
jgi:hypothetical protein